MCLCAHSSTLSFSRLSEERMRALIWSVRMSAAAHSVKRAKVFVLLKSLAADVVFLQETHIRSSFLRCFLTEISALYLGRQTISIFSNY